MATTKLTTADELLVMPDDGYRCELMWGESVRMSRPNGDHAALTADVTIALGAHVVPRRLGEVLSGDTGVYLERAPDLVLAPDVAFYRAGRLPPRGQRQGYLAIVVDLVIGIVSPSETRRDVAEKVELWRRFSVPLVWVVHPQRRTMTAHAADGSLRTFGVGDVLDGGEVLPEFRLALAGFFGE